ncbi:MAG: hypothetical protein KAY32_03950 [Candidatus Eisenbacteria sp.]|nr:hypothetical protein [Candidatus Eisenbacteria bacterium]
MKIRSVKSNNHRKAFEVRTSARVLAFPFAKASPQPSVKDALIRVWVDPELGREGFTYVLQSGREGTIHIDQVLEYNQDPRYMRDLLLHKLTIEAIRRVEKTWLSKREIIRRLGTSATQFYRLLDPTNYRKSIDQMLRLLSVLDCEVELVVRERSG